MKTWKVDVSTMITGSIVVEAETEDEARELGVADFVATGKAPQTSQSWADQVVELQPVVKPERCEIHDEELVMVAGKVVCPRCAGAYGGND